MMKTNRITLNLPSLLVMLALLCVIGVQAAARRPAMINPTVVVTVDRSRVLENLDERAAAEASLRRMQEQLKVDLEQRQAEVQDLEAQLETATGAERTRVQREYEKKGIHLQQYAQFCNDRIDMEEALLYQSLYRSIASAIDQMAKAEGYDIVLVYEGEEEFSPYNPNLRISRANQIRQQIAEKRIMYANDAVDITDGLILRMNNAFNAG